MRALNCLAGLAVLTAVLAAPAAGAGYAAIVKVSSYDACNKKTREHSSSWSRLDEKGEAGEAEMVTVSATVPGEDGGPDRTVSYGFTDWWQVRLTPADKVRVECGAKDVWHPDPKSIRLETVEDSLKEEVNVGETVTLKLKTRRGVEYLVEIVVRETKD